MKRSRGGPPSLRQLRVGEELRHALVRVLAKGRLGDPVLAEANITVTEVGVSPDLGFLRGQLSGELTLRYTPRLEFAADRSFEHAVRVQDILESARVRRDLQGAGEMPSAAATDGPDPADEDGGHGQ
jgi:ribosome-binding factor A